MSGSHNLKSKSAKHRVHDQISLNVLGKQWREMRDLHTAVLAENVAKVSELLSSGISANLSDDKRRSGLHFAAAQGNEALVKLFLRHGADVNQKDCLSNVPLHLAVSNNCVPVVTALLKAGTDVNAVNCYGSTPLHLAHSKLNVLKSEHYVQQPIKDTKKQITEVLDMLQEYFQRKSEHSTDMDQLLAFAGKLSLSETPEEIGEVQELLTNFTSLSLHAGPDVMK